MREVQDHYFREAKREGYLSRAAYKLIEIDDRRKILHPGDRVLDCGAAPGSWLQVAAKRVGPKGLVVGVDLQPIKPLGGVGGMATVHTITGDATTIPPAELLKLPGEPTRLFDVILSDMAPSTSGDPSGDHFRSVRLCEALLDRCAGLLRPGGNLVMKVFEGQAYPQLLKRTQSMFEAAKGFKPKASRSESTEMYIVATGYRAAAASGDAPQGDHAAAPPKRPAPQPGWNWR